MKQIIELKDTEKRKMIAQAFGISLPNLSQILRFHRNGSNAEAVRKMAEENGGIRMIEDNRERIVKILNSKGETERVVTIKQ